MPFDGSLAVRQTEVLDQYLTKHCAGIPVRRIGNKLLYRVDALEHARNSWRTSQSHTAVSMRPW